MRVQARWLVLLAVLAAIPLLGATAAAQAPEPRYGGTLRVAIAAEPPGLDPTISTSQEIARIVYGNVHQGLVRIDREGRIVAALAERWTVSDDGTVYTFHLRPGVRFHDGSELDAGDVLEMLQRATDPHSGHTHPEYYRDITAFEAVDPLTVRIELARPNAEFLYNLARPDSVIFPAGTAAQQAANPVGAGPFRVVAWQRGSRVILARFDQYYDPALPYLDGVEFRFMPDPNTQLAALLAGDIDVIGYGLTPENGLILQNQPGFKLVEGSSTSEVILAMNHSRSPFHDRRVRQAITHAINRPLVIEAAMFGFGIPIGSHMTPAEPYYLDLTDHTPYDPERARALLAEAGYPQGFTATLALPAPYEYARRAGEVVAEQLRQVGIQLRLEIVEWTTWLARIFNQAEYDMTIIGHAEPLDIGIYGNPNYYFRYDSPVVQELLNQVTATFDEGARAQLYGQIQRQIADDAVNVFLFALPYLAAMRADVHGWWVHQPTVALDVSEVFFR
ncbi:MAG: ABC transporter substrate-binding protein [Limnochorda sp.]|uniref:ABC transporter substrate-binding protein n=1 Tax=Limnochorda sp. TaxID=1940279 RepID=UPI0039C40371